MNIENRLVDLKRKKVPIHATEIRADFQKNQKFLDEIVYKDLKKL